MRVLHRTRPLPDAFRGAGVAIGNFDGVHAGHRAVVVAASRLVPDRPVGALTFEPHPRELLQPERAPPRITQLAQKLARLREAGVGFTDVQAFDHALCTMPAEAFVRSILVDRLGVGGVAIGRDFRFGHRRSGDGEMLRRMGSVCGFAVVVVDPVEIDGAPCSSTRIREHIASGDVAAAAVLLGRPHRIEGTVVHGDHRGRTIGFPTANLRPRGKRPLLPATGVYAATARIARDPQRVWNAIVNLGYRPTFAGRDLRFEVHLLDVERDLYGQRLQVDLVDRVRSEMRFESVGDLVRQIEVDCVTARTMLDAARADTTRSPQARSEPVASGAATGTVE